MTDGSNTRLPEPSSTWVTRGAKTNRVKRTRGRPRKPAAEREPTEYSPQRAKAMLRAGVAEPYTVVSLTIPVGELEALDAYCQRTRSKRSHAIREAVRRLLEAKP